MLNHLDFDFYYDTSLVYRKTSKHNIAIISSIQIFFSLKMCISLLITFECAIHKLVCNYKVSEPFFTAMLSAILLVTIYIIYIYIIYIYIYIYNNIYIYIYIYTATVRCTQY